MKAAVLGDSGLEIREIPAPAPKPDGILVQVRACGLNRGGVMMAAGPEVTKLAVGQRVMGSGTGG